MIKLALLYLLSFSTVAFSVEGLDFLGELDFEQRAFEDDNDSTTVDKGSIFSILGEINLERNDHFFKFRGTGRTDLEDSSRDWTNIEDAYYDYSQEQYNIRVGFQTINWTATEAFHPADIINSRQLDGNVEYFPKIGEPMLQFKYLLSSGALTFFYMPRYMSPDFPASSNRLGSSFDLEDPEWIEDGKVSLDNYGNQFALRFNWSFDDSDLSLHFVDHMDRDNPIVRIDGISKFVPVYFQKRQFGGTYQGVFEKFILKIEGAYKDFKDPVDITTIYGTDRPEDYAAVALGGEYPFVFESGGELTLITEWQKVFGLSSIVASRRQVFQNDYLLGGRYAFNDIDSKELFIYYIGDFDRQSEFLINGSYSQRLTEKLKMSLGGRYIDAPPRDTITIVGLGTFDDPKGIEVYHKDHQVYGRLTYFF